MYLPNMVIPWLLLVVAAHSAADVPKLDLDDVSWLWPPPQSTQDLTSVISMGAFLDSNGDAVWSDEQFADLLDVVNSSAVEVNGIRIGFEAAFATKSTWKIAAMRVDPCAPGGNEVIRERLGSNPQIRLIVQPVTTSASRAEVHDVAVHLVYSFLKDGQRGNPDFEYFRRIVSDLDELKRQTTMAGVTTSGKPLGIHPGLARNDSGLHVKVQEFLSRHLKQERLTAMALMGIRDPEPWIFIALGKGANGRFGPIPIFSAQMIDFRDLSVSPDPIVNNRSPITSDIVVPKERRRGVATASLFRAIDLDAFAVIGIDETGQDVVDGEVRNRDIPDIIADPGRSHFFNTDCVSCHTETRRRERLQLPESPMAFRVGGVLPPISPEVTPKDDWNVRNFGWFKPSPFIGGGPTVGTVTQRTANETAEVVEFIERNFRGNIR